MFIRLATFEVRPDALEDFRTATLRHAARSRSEEGVGRFEFYRGEASKQFLLFIEFENEEARTRHFETSSIKEWRSTILPMLTKPIHVLTYVPIEET